MSQIITDFYKGNPVTIVTVFQDNYGNVVVPDSAIIKFAYYVNRLATNDTLNMTQTDGTDEWSVTWDSTVADAGVVEYSIVTSNPRIVRNGAFRLVGNKANP